MAAPKAGLHIEGNPEGVVGDVVYFPKLEFPCQDLFTSAYVCNACVMGNSVSASVLRTWCSKS